MGPDGNSRKKWGLKEIMKEIEKELKKKLSEKT